MKILAFLLVSALAVANIAYTGHIPGVPVWAHWIMALPLGAATFMALFAAIEDL